MLHAGQREREREREMNELILNRSFLLKGGNESYLREEFERWRCPISAVRRCDDEQFYRDIEVSAKRKFLSHSILLDNLSSPDPL